MKKGLSFFLTQVFLTFLALAMVSVTVVVVQLQFIRSYKGKSLFFVRLFCTMFINIHSFGSVKQGRSLSAGRVLSITGFWSRILESGRTEPFFTYLLPIFNLFIYLFSVRIG